MSGGCRNGLLSPLAARSTLNAVPQSDLYTVRELLIGLKRNIKSGLGSIRNFGAFIDIRFQGRYNVVNVDEEVVILRSPLPADVPVSLSLQPFEFFQISALVKVALTGGDGEKADQQTDRKRQELESCVQGCVIANRRSHASCEHLSMRAQ